MEQGMKSFNQLKKLQEQLIAMTLWHTVAGLTIDFTRIQDLKFNVHGVILNFLIIDINIGKVHKKRKFANTKR